MLRKIEFIRKGRHEIFHLRHVICKSHALSSQKIIMIISLTIHSFIYVRIQRITYLFTHYFVYSFNLVQITIIFLLQYKFEFYHVTVTVILTIFLPNTTLLGYLCRVLLNAQDGSVAILQKLLFF